MATKFTPLELALIDEGRFLAQADEDLLRAQTHLVRYLEEHQGLARKARATLALTISLTCENPDQKMFSVKATTATKLPNRPASVTLALEGEAEAGQPCLFVRRSGSGRDTPGQNLLLTEDGRTVNPDSGEVIDKAKTAKGR